VFANVCQFQDANPLRIVGERLATVVVFPRRGVAERPAFTVIIPVVGGPKKAIFQSAIKAFNPATLWVLVLAAVIAFQ
jgi:hypothetical protein